MFVNDLAQFPPKKKIRPNCHMTIKRAPFIKYEKRQTLFCVCSPCTVSKSNLQSLIHHFQFLCVFILWNWRKNHIDYVCVMKHNGKSTICIEQRSKAYSLQWNEFYERGAPERKREFWIGIFMDGNGNIEANRENKIAKRKEMEVENRFAWPCSTWWWWYFFKNRLNAI